jgi:hypothetical protein
LGQILVFLKVLRVGPGQELECPINREHSETQLCNVQL